MRRRRTLSAEEKRLWSEIAATAQPLKGKALPPVPVLLAPPPAVEPAGVPAAVLPASPGGPKGTRAVSAPQRTLAPLHPIERPVRRRLGRGRLALEDRIDLHGLTEAVAHAALLGFLRRAQGEGARHVLVITGRGASFGSMGALKRALPHWFATPDFRRLVSGYEPAERNHGGEGAFYVRVRRP